MKFLLTGLLASMSLAAAFLSTSTVSTASAAEGDYLVGNTTSVKSGELLRITPAGDFTTIVDGLGGPADITVDSNGDLIITDLRTSRLLRVTLSGTVTVITDRLARPIGVAIDADGNFIIAQLGGSLLKVTPGGDVTTIIESLGDLSDLVIDSGGDYFVTSPRRAGYPALLKITPGGELSIFFESTSPFAMHGVAIDKDGYFIVSNGFDYSGFAATVDRINPNTRVVEQTFFTGCSDARKVAIDADGNYIVSCPASFANPDSVIRITPTGDVTVVASSTELGFPIGIAIESSDPILDLIAKIEQLVEDDELIEGEGNSLIVKLTGAAANLESDDISGACGKLAAFINEVNAIITSGRLSEDQGLELINAVNAIRDSIPCSQLILAPSVATDSDMNQSVRKGAL